MVEDDKEQLIIVKKIFQEEKAILLLNTVLLEMAWVLQTVYQATREDISKALIALIHLPCIVPETKNIVSAINWYAEGMDFGDALHLAVADDHDSKELITFDAAFVRKAKDKTVCIVKEATLKE